MLAVRWTAVPIGGFGPALELMIKSILELPDTMSAARYVECYFSQVGVLSETNSCSLGPFICW
jgi:hypothetical protein